MKIVGLVFKELLRIYQLNKPFRGGIGSFVLVILVHNILKKVEKIAQEDYFQQMMAVSHFMAQQFEPYRTVVTSSSSVVQGNPKQQLNIADPESNQLLNTSKIRQMEQIIELFSQCKILLQAIVDQLKTVNPEQKKKMKRLFFEKWNVLFQPHQYEAKETTVLGSEE